ncbi:MAG: helix-turn-helix domain-containing protein [Chloroflexi bacterium]|nr:helix-turn-helix domain-containing protein [Chloroflexota bacterium]
MLQEPDLGIAAALIGEPTRAKILSALMGGEPLPASELAYRAHVTPQTASSHLAKLLEGDLIRVTPSGRHRYYSLKNHEVAELLEALSLVAPVVEPKHLRTTKISPELCHARTCYDHLAGKLGVALANALLQQAFLHEDEQNYKLTDKGVTWFASWQIDVERLKKKQRKFAYACLDWSERHYHIAGALGAAIADVFFENGWIKRVSHSRAVKITPAGETFLANALGITFLETSQVASHTF